MRSRVVFGLVGAVAALLAAMALEAVFGWTAMSARVQGERVQALIFPEPPTTVVNGVRVGTGDIRAALSWDNANDLDLHVIDPRSERIFLGHRLSRSRGELDVDANANGAAMAHPVENIFWPPGRAPSGTYRVFVHHFAMWCSEDPTEYTVDVHVGRQVRHFAGRMEFRGTQHPAMPIWDFVYRRPSPLLVLLLRNTLTLPIL